MKAATLAMRKWRAKNPEKAKASTNKASDTWRNRARFGGNVDMVLQRDGHQCVKCGMTNEQHLQRWKRRLTIDHINGDGRWDSNSETRNNDLSNLQTLCLHCHGKKDIWKRKDLLTKSEDK